MAQECSHTIGRLFAATTAQAADPPAPPPTSAPLPATARPPPDAAKRLRNTIAGQAGMPKAIQVDGRTGQARKKRATAGSIDLNGGQGERAATSERLGDVAEILKRTLCITLKSESTTAVASVQAVAQDAVTTLSTQLGNGFNVLQTKLVEIQSGLKNSTQVLALESELAVAKSKIDDLQSRLAEVEEVKQKLEDDLVKVKTEAQTRENGVLKQLKEAQSELQSGVDFLCNRPPAAPPVGATIKEREIYRHLKKEERVTQKLRGELEAAGRKIRRLEDEAAAHDEQLRQRDLANQSLQRALQDLQLSVGVLGAGRSGGYGGGYSSGRR